MSGAITGAIDWAQVRAILRSSLKSSLRSSGRMSMGRQKPRGLIFLLVMYALMGAFAGMLALTHPDLFTWALVLHGMTLFLCGGALVAESPNLLFSTNEHDVLGHRPIDPRTLLLGLSLRLVLLSGSLALALNLCPTFFVLATRGAAWWTPLAHLIADSLLVLFSAGAVVFVYVILTRLVGRERFDSFATWAQVGVTATFIFGYQIIPRLIDRTRGLHISADLPFLWLLPPAWFAALETLMGGQSASPKLWAMATAAVLIPALIGWAAVARLAAGYAERLASLGETPMPRPTSRDVRRPTAMSRMMNPILRAWMRDPIERRSFHLAAVYMGRDRDMRMRLYPSFASLLVFPFLPLIDRKAGAISAPLITLVMAGSLPLSAMLTLKMSPHYAAADIFHYTPIRGAASVFHGVRKATILYVMAPGVAIAGTILWFTLPSHASLLTLLPAVLVLPTLSLLLGLGGDYLPLSVPPTTGRQAGLNMGVMISSMILSAGLFVLGYLGRRFGWFWPLIALELIVLVPFHLLMLRGIRTRTLKVE